MHDWWPVSCVGFDVQKQGMLASTRGGPKFSWFHVNVLIYWNPEQQWRADAMEREGLGKGGALSLQWET